MRIGIMLQSIRHFGGIGVYTQQIVDKILEKDRENEYVLLYPSFSQAKTVMGRYEHHENVTEVLSKSLVPHNLYWDHFVVPREARKHQIDMIFNPFLSVPLFGKFSKVFVIHGFEWFTMPEVFWFTARYTGRFRITALMKAADIVISVSQYAADVAVDSTGIPREKFRIIHNAAGAEFRPINDSASLKSVQEKYGLPDDFILFVGGIYPSKNFGGLLQAFRSAAQQIPHTLLVAGKTRWKSEDDMQLVQEYGLEDRVRFMGWIGHEDLPAIYNLAACFAIPSFHESCSVALLEALSCGCPVIASTAGGNPETAGDAAVFIDPHDLEAIEEALVEVASSQELRRELSRKGLLRSKAFSWDKSAEDTLAVFSELA